MQRKAVIFFLASALFFHVCLQAEEKTIVNRFANSFSLIESGDQQRVGRGLKSLASHLSHLNPDELSLENFEYIYKNIPKNVKINSDNFSYAKEIFSLWKMIYDHKIYPKEHVNTNLILKKYKKTRSTNFEKDSYDNYLGTLKIFKSDIDINIKKILSDLKKDDFQGAKYFKKIKMLLKKSIIDANLEDEIFQVFLDRFEKFIKNNSENIYLIKPELLNFLNELSSKSKTKSVSTKANKLINEVKSTKKGKNNEV